MTARQVDQSGFASGSGVVEEVELVAGLLVAGDQDARCHRDSSSR